MSCLGAGGVRATVTPRTFPKGTGNRSRQGGRVQDTVPAKSVQTVAGGSPEEGTKRHEGVIARWPSRVGGPVGQCDARFPRDIVEDQEDQAVPSHTDRLGKGAGRIFQKLQSCHEQHHVHSLIAKREAMGVTLDTEDLGLSPLQRSQHPRRAVETHDTPRLPREMPREVPRPAAHLQDPLRLREVGKQPVQQGSLGSINATPFAAVGLVTGSTGSTILPRHPGVFGPGHASRDGHGHHDMSGRCGSIERPLQGVEKKRRLSGHQRAHGAGHDLEARPRGPSAICGSLERAAPAAADTG